MAPGTGGADDPIDPAPGQAVDADGNAQVVVRTEGDRHPDKGEVIRVAPKPGRVHLFDTGSGLRLDSREPAGSSSG